MLSERYILYCLKTKATIIVQTQWMKENVSSILNNKILKVDKINIDENIINKQINENKRNMKHFFYPASNIPYKTMIFL